MYESKVEEEKLETEKNDGGTKNASTRDGMVLGSIPGRSGGKIFFSRVNFLF